VELVIVITFPGNWECKYCWQISWNRTEYFGYQGLDL